MDDQQLNQVEHLADTLYTGNTSQLDRTKAQAQLLSLQSSAKFIPQCQYILDRSQNQYACLVASNSLIELLTTHW